MTLSAEEFTTTMRAQLWADILNSTEEIGPETSRDLIAGMSDHTLRDALLAWACHDHAEQYTPLDLINTELAVHQVATGTASAHRIDTLGARLSDLTDHNPPPTTSKDPPAALGGTPTPTRGDCRRWGRRQSSEGLCLSQGARAAAFPQ